MDIVWELDALGVLSIIKDLEDAKHGGDAWRRQPSLRGFRSDDPIDSKVVYSDEIALVIGTAAELENPNSPSRRFGMEPIAALAGMEFDQIHAMFGRLGNALHEAGNDEAIDIVLRELCRVHHELRNGSAEESGDSQ